MLGSTGGFVTMSSVLQLRFLPRFLVHAIKTSYFPQFIQNQLLSIINCKMSNENSPAKRLCGESTAPIIGTHSGTFHCDELLACFLLRQLPEYAEAKILRSRDIKLLRERCNIIVDVGGEFDHAQKLYDHHQVTFQETLSSLRPELGNEFDIRLSSAGLIYTFYGERVIESILQRERNLQLSAENLRVAYIQIYRNFIREIDAIDNGVPMLEVGEPRYKISTHLSARIGNFNPLWDEESNDADIEQRFNRAMAAAGAEFIQNVIYIGSSWLKARNYVREAIENAKENYPTGEILFLKQFCPWKSHLADLEKDLKLEGLPKLVIFQENTKSWRVAGVPITPSSFLGRKFLPKAWRGLKDEELSNTAEISDLIFVHSTGFIGGATNKDSALAMAIKCIEWPDAEK